MSASDLATRREFLLRLAAMGAVLPHAPEHSRNPAITRAGLRDADRLAQDSMPARAIPATGEKLPVVGFGSSKAVLEIPEQGTTALENVLRMLVARGGRVVDTSPRVEDIDARFGPLLNLAELRDRLFVAAKINTTGRPAGIDQMRRMQRLFDRSTLDLVQVESMRGLETHWPSLREWKESGQARYIGVTVSSDALHDRLEAFMRRESFDFVHVNYSVVETRAEERLLPLAEDRGMAVLTNRPFMNGEYFRRVESRELPAWAADFDCASWAQFSLKYILSHPSVTCALTETTNPVHLDENIQAAFGRIPDESTRRRMRELAATL
ncbi:MAG: aldo/keto reductase [Gemmatimonadetes bacterium]|nr:aldo/keto reductase [Gemmatimonadota bacterium]